MKDIRFEPGRASRIIVRVAVGFVLLLLPCFGFAQTLTGTVKNGTTNKPAAGDEVVLLKLGEGMEEAGRTKTDARGNFSFKLDDSQSPHLIRVIHQEVTYHQMAPPGTTSAEVEVYDVAKKLDQGVSVVADIMRMQVEQGQLEVVRMFAVDNTSKPPRTQMNEHNLEFYVPDGAKILGGQAVTQGGNPINSAPVPEAEKNKYSFIFPLRPGTTQFQAAYQLPYTGSANIDPKSPYPMQHFVAILPKQMEFTPAVSNAAFQAMKDPNQPDANVQVASNTKVGQNLAFKISGEGTLAEQQEGNGEQGESASADNNNRPGGGLGPPIDAPDPLQKYRWYILGGFAAVLIVGGVFVASRQQAAARATVREKAGAGLQAHDLEAAFPEADLQETDSQFAEMPPAQTRTGQIPAASQAKSSSSMLLEGLKEELFQLELDRRQGKISPSEYEKAKAALDLTLDRALKREAQKA
ncbi:MAG TPA: hypothetical protein VMU61_17335 [Candidatus Aquilonibacter sp.]|nr:hypothetical protein [Candidatus Aquilonibacter sp.]